MDAIWPQSLKYFLFGSLQKKSVDPQTKTKGKRQQQYVVKTEGPQLEKMSPDLGKTRQAVGIWNERPGGLVGKQNSCPIGWE